MKISLLHKNLIRRYLLWAYKTTRESFERIERKTTQLKVDEYILKSLNHSVSKDSGENKDYKKLVKEFELYIERKRTDELKQKYADTTKTAFTSEYLYLRNRLSAVEGAIHYFLGPRELKNMETSFENEFTTRILQAREHS